MHAISALQALSSDCCQIQVKNPWRTIFSRRYMPELMTAIWIPIFQQLTGPPRVSCQYWQLSIRAGHVKQSQSPVIPCIVDGARACWIKGGLSSGPYMIIIMPIPCVPPACVREHLHQ